MSSLFRFTKANNLPFLAIYSWTGIWTSLFLAIASMSGYVVDQYDDAPVGYLEKGENGRLWLARVVMHPKIVFSGEKQPSPEDLARLHEKAHHECFLANSVKTEVTWD
jgi:organic hydroperoxide reductase OsmC/OhrA